jgi:hypothetical protein
MIKLIWCMLLSVFRNDGSFLMISDDDKYDGPEEGKCVDASGKPTGCFWKRG